MNENRSLLKKVLSNYQRDHNSSSTRYLSPCEILTEYLRDPCYVFSENIIQTNEFNPMPLVPSIPLIPPIPQIPPINPILPIPQIPPINPMLPIPPIPQGPGPFRGSAELRTLGVVPIDNGEFFEFRTLETQGNAIQHIDGSSDIILAPNTAYKYSWSIEILTNDPVFILIGGALELDGEIIPNSEGLTPGSSAMPIIAEARGQFITGDNEAILRLVYSSNAHKPLDSYSILNIDTI